MGEARTLDGRRTRADAAARLLHRTHLQPTRAASPGGTARRHASRTNGRFRLPPRGRRLDAVGPGQDVGGRRRLQRHATTAAVSRGVDRGRGRPSPEAGSRPRVGWIPWRPMPYWRPPDSSTNRTRATGPAGLTARESEVLARLAQGMPNKAIARTLGISPKTVSNHIERVYSKLGVSNRAGAAMAAMQFGIAGPLARGTPGRTGDAHGRGSANQELKTPGGCQVGGPAATRGHCACRRHAPRRYNPLTKFPARA